MVVLSPSTLLLFLAVVVSEVVSENPEAFQNVVNAHSVVTLLVI